jgi:hypothetical protein
LHSLAFGDILRNMEIEMSRNQCVEDLSKTVNYLHGFINIDLDQSNDYLDFLYQSTENPVQLTVPVEQAARSIGRLYIASMYARNRTLERYTYQEQAALGFVGGRTGSDDPISLVQMTRRSYQDGIFTVNRFFQSLLDTTNAVTKLRSRTEADPLRILESYDNLINPKSS